MHKSDVDIFILKKKSVEIILMFIFLHTAAVTIETFISAFREFENSNVRNFVSEIIKYLSRSCAVNLDPPHRPGIFFSMKKNS